MNQSHNNPSTQLPNIVYFHKGYQTNPYECTDAISDAMGCTYTLLSTWEELTRELINGAKFVAFHLEMIEKIGPSIPEFIDAITTIARYFPSVGRLQIGVVIKKDTKLSSIKQLQNTKVSGILLDINDFSMDEVVNACTALINGKPYWPEHIISQLSDIPSRPVNAYFREDWATYSSTIDFENVKDTLEMECDVYTSWDDLGRALENNPHQLTFHVDMIKRLDIAIPEIISMLETQLKLASLSIPIGVVFAPDTPVSVIKELKKSGVFGVVPCVKGWGTSEAIKAFYALRDRIPYWPKDIIDQLPGAVKKAKVDTQGIRLTTRQFEVMELVCKRGLSNKGVAKMLHISESTVKIHVSAVMKAYGVRNRTQLALTASSSLKA